MGLRSATTCTMIEEVTYINGLPHVYSWTCPCDFCRRVAYLKRTTHLPKAERPSAGPTPQEWAEIRARQRRANILRSQFGKFEDD